MARGIVLLGVAQLVTGCASAPLPMPRPSQHAHVALDTTCRSPVSARRWHPPRDGSAPAIALTDDALAGRYDVTVVMTVPQLPDSEATSSGPMELWDHPRVERYQRVTRVGGPRSVLGTDRIPLLDPGGGIGIGGVPADTTWVGNGSPLTPTLIGSRGDNGSVEWTIGLGLDRGWTFVVFAGDATRLVGRWYWGNTGPEGYFCAVKHRAPAT